MSINCNYCHAPIPNSEDLSPLTIVYCNQECEVLHETFGAEPKPEQQ